jgi:hypothetical protein
LVLQNPIQLPTHQVIPLPTTPNQDTKVDINNIHNSNEICNDNNPNVEKKKWYYKDQPSHGSHSKSSKSL